MSGLSGHHVYSLPQPILRCPDKPFQNELAFAIAVLRLQAFLLLLTLRANQHTPKRFSNWRTLDQIGHQLGFYPLTPLK
jgi:hypothetical protein